MDSFSQKDLRDLMVERGAPRVSIYLATARAGKETLENPVRLRNALREAEDALEARGTDERAIASLLEPARKRLDAAHWWQHQAEGLAVFLSPEGARFVRVPASFEPRVFVGDRFYAKPLVAWVRERERLGVFYLLTLSRGHVALYRGDADGLQALHPDDLPGSFDEAVRLDDPGTPVQAHTLGGAQAGRAGSVLYHGHGGTDRVHEELRVFCRRVAEAVWPVLAAEQPLLVVAALEELAPVYRDAHDAPGEILWLRGNPDDWKPAELHARAREVVAEARPGADDALAEYARLAGTGRASAQPDRVLQAAIEGRVARLLAAADAEVWGAFDPDGREVELHAEPTPHSDALGDRALVEALQNGAEVWVLPVERMPDGAAVAATFRY